MLSTASALCGSKGCYKAADILIYRNKKKVYVCKEHNKKPERDNQLELFKLRT